jgi:hypothetical protein
MSSSPTARRVCVLPARRPGRSPSSRLISRPRRASFGAAHEGSAHRQLEDWEGAPPDRSEIRSVQSGRADPIATTPRALVNAISRLRKRLEFQSPIPSHSNACRRDAFDEGHRLHMGSQRMTPNHAMQRKRGTGGSCFASLVSAHRPISARASLMKHLSEGPIGRGAR